MCLFLGTSRFFPSAALIGDMDWQPTFSRQMISVSNFWQRLCLMPRSRTNYKVFMYANSVGSTRCKNDLECSLECFRTKQIFDDLECTEFCNIDNMVSKKPS
jgi:hypothetical protein